MADANQEGLHGQAGLSPKTEPIVRALAKDMVLLADEPGTPLPSATALVDNVAGPEGDIAPAALVAAVDEDVLTPLRTYIRGHATGDPVHFREAFRPTAHIEGIREGKFVSWPVDEYCRLFNGSPAPDERSRLRRIDSVQVHGTVATASMTLWHGRDTFTDVFLLVNESGRWRIANKAYHRHS
jgi:Putative lumazine-binding